MASDGVNGLELQRIRLRRRRQIEWIVGIVIFVAFVVFVTRWFVATRNELIGVPVPISDLVELDRICGLNFPTDTVFFGGWYRKGWHYTAVAKIRMPASAIAHFVKDKNIEADYPLQDESRSAGGDALFQQFEDPAFRLGDLPGPDIRKVHKYSIANWDAPKSGYTVGGGSMLFDLDDPRVVTVFLRYFAD